VVDFVFADLVTGRRREIMSAVAHSRVKEFLDMLEDEYDIPPGLISVRSKLETPRFVLPLIIKSGIDKFRSDE